MYLARIANNVERVYPLDWCEVRYLDRTRRQLVPRTCRSWLFDSWACSGAAAVDKTPEKALIRAQERLWGAFD